METTTSTDPSWTVFLFADLFFVWYLIVIAVAYNGFFTILFKFTKKSRSRSLSESESSACEGVTILRPLKGIDPELETCLRSSFLQKYPKSMLEIIFCVQDQLDPAISIAKKLIAEYPDIDAKLLIDPDQTSKCSYGPNPKVNNLAKGYEAAKFDILWIQDSNVWSRPDTLQRSVVALTRSLNNGKPTSRKVNLVHHAPLAVSLGDCFQGALGASLDEMFLGTAHSKFYVSLNEVAVAPCVNGKSNVYRRSELDEAVFRMGQSASAPSSDGQSGDIHQDARYYSLQPGHGIRFFARYIGEDNMIGIALWDYCHGRTAMTGDCVVQPLGGSNGLLAYCHRRIRWLRVRKYMVLAATLLEPTTECLLSGLYGGFAMGVLFGSSYFSKWFFTLHVLVWLATDYIQMCHLFDSVRGGGIEEPFFVELSSSRVQEKSPTWFLTNWLLRELLALPVWVVAVLGSHIDWRGQPFRIKADLSAEKL
ncbi:hypothetical protein OGAPHI_004101 [Ogataea philodendri]|uniref:Ceramide glucosyltransferase n=1 Tax=Ogataea philodendri TaxID=1378263 RepID=A0A9P8P618_9ASCO|nr:uncharacterized protein OGAPHI_004101 [Ogataea philodendri]KAH3665912.1 hypothetical protein OGAPHI_004101 [Ogataea philodendri]